MPYPAQVNRDQIIEKARAMVEAEGLDTLTLQNLATALGVQAPSLYRYVRNKNELLRAVNEITARRLIDTLTDAAQTADDPTVRALHMARAYRSFALEYPATYALAFAATVPDTRPDPKILEALALPIQALMAGVSGEAASLTALRGFWSLIHGFVMLEFSGQFQRGGDLTATFEAAVMAYIRGWQTG